MLIAVICTSGFVAVLWYCVNVKIKTKPSEAFLKKEFLISLLAYLIAMLVVWRAFMPNQTSPDTVNQWQQIHGEIRLSDVHSVTHTLIMKLLMQIWDSYAVVILSQIILVSIMLAFFTEYICRKGLPLKITFWVTFAFVFAGSAEVYFFPWKDTYYTVCIAVLVYYTIRIIDKSIKINLLHSSIIGLAMGLAILVRKNAIVSVLGFAIVLLYWLFCEKQKYVINCFAVMLGCILVMNFIGYNIFKAEKSDKNGFAYAVFGTAIAAVIAQEGEISAEQQQLINQILPVNFVKENYSEKQPYTLLWTKHSTPDEFFSNPNNDVYNNYFVIAMADHKTEIIKLYFELLPKNFKIMFNHIIQSTRSLWAFDYYTEEQIRVINGNTFLIFHSMEFIMLMLAAVCTLDKKRIKYAFLMMLPVVLNSVSIAISAVTNELRYLQPMFMLFAPMLLMIIVWAREDQTQMGRKLEFFKKILQSSAKNTSLD